MKNDLLILFGGGIDSTSLAISAWQDHKNALLLYFDYGAKAKVGELKALEYVASKFHFPYEVIEVPSQVVPKSTLTEGVSEPSQKRNEVPGRNLLFLTLAFSFALRYGIPLIWIGADNPPDVAPGEWNGFPDTKQAMFDAFNATTTLGYGAASPRVSAPLLTMRGTEEYAKHSLLEMPDLFDRVFSCYDSRTESPCGRCNHCLRNQKLVAKLKAGMHPIGGRNEDRSRTDA